jgi:hypothetical protein
MIGLGDVVSVETKSNKLSFKLVHVKICHWNHAFAVYLTEHTTTYHVTHGFAVD